MNSPWQDRAPSLPPPQGFLRGAQAVGVPLEPSASPPPGRFWPKTQRQAWLCAWGHVAVCTLCAGSVCALQSRVSRRDLCVHGARTCTGCGIYILSVSGVRGLQKPSPQWAGKGSGLDLPTGLAWRGKRRNLAQALPRAPPRSGSGTSKSLPWDFSRPPCQLPTWAPSLHRPALNSMELTLPLPGAPGAFSPFPRGSSSRVPNSWPCYRRGSGGRGTGGVPARSGIPLPFLQPSSLPHPQPYKLTRPPLAVYLTGDKWPAAF